MIRFSPCKINIGLDVVERRPDGYHNIVTAMVPVPWHDIIEIIPQESIGALFYGNENTALKVLGNPVDCPPQDNLVMKAYWLMANQYFLPAVDIILQKIVPDNAGLGGGSADAATTLLLLNEVFHKDASREDLEKLAVKLGADCAFFLHDRPMLCTGIGADMTPIDLPLQGWHLLIAKPQTERVSTAVAYSRVKPSQPKVPLEELLLLPVEEWQGRVKNDFEPSVFAFAPQCAAVKQTMLDAGATYASMSGSGASIYGLFKTDNLSRQCQELLAPTCTTFACTL